MEAFIPSPLSPSSKVCRSEGEMFVLAVLYSSLSAWSVVTWRRESQWAV